MSRTCALVPIRSLHGGKTRLSEMFDSRQRAHLVLAMAHRLLAELQASQVADDILVLTNDGPLIDALTVQGIRLLPDVPPGLNAAVDFGRREALASGADRVLVVFADLPEVDRADLIAIDQSSGAITIVPDRLETGTNALLLQGEAMLGAFRFSYGPGSFLAHLAEAERLGTMPVVLHRPTLAADLDTVDDWQRLSSATRSRLLTDHQHPTFEGASIPLLVEHS